MSVFNDYLFLIISPNVWPKPCSFSAADCVAHLRVVDKLETLPCNNLPSLLSPHNMLIQPQSCMSTLHCKLWYTTMYPGAPKREICDARSHQNTSHQNKLQSLQWKLGFAVSSTGAQFIPFRKAKWVRIPNLAQYGRAVIPTFLEFLFLSFLKRRTIHWQLTISTSSEDHFTSCAS